MELITAYEIVYAINATKLTEKVNAKIKVGFQPLGGVAFAFPDLENKYGDIKPKDLVMQAMVKY